MPMLSRPRRNRKNTAIRDLVKENQLQVTDLIMPLFIIEGHNKKVPIESMPGQYRYTLDLLIQKVNELSLLGIKCIALFPVIEEHLKTKDAKEAYNPDGLYLNAIKEIKKACPEILLMTDIALDPYSSDGHDGLVAADGEILNDETLEVLKKMAVAQARAGSDILGPSDMMDGRIEAIRVALDGQGFEHVSIMAYTAKYASGFYGPFRDALDSAPKAGDKKTYQMDFSNNLEALREISLDIKEGADMVMVKPGMPYLDIIKSIKESFKIPVLAYQVSGEYSLIKNAINKKLISENSVLETLTGFKRAGASAVVTYFADKIAKTLK